MRVPSLDFLALLKTLDEHKVDFIIVGGVSAVLHGSPITTFDLDLLHSRAPENISRLLAALKKIEAIYRGLGEPRIEPTGPQLASPGHKLLITRFGSLDLHGTIGKEGLSYDDLITHTKEMHVIGMTLRVLDLETLIKIKEELGQEKDKAVVPILLRTLEEKKKKEL
jgi:predicted nucleotidyltransferase